MICSYRLTVPGDQAGPTAIPPLLDLSTVARLRGRRRFQRNSLPNNRAPGPEPSAFLRGSATLWSQPKCSLRVCRLGSDAPSHIEADRNRDSVAKTRCSNRQESRKTAFSCHRAEPALKKTTMPAHGE